MSPRLVFVLILVAATVAAAGAGPARADVIYAGPTEQGRPVFVRENAEGRVVRLFVSWQAICPPGPRLVRGTTAFSPGVVTRRLDLRRTSTRHAGASVIRQTVRVVAHRSLTPARGVTSAAWAGTLSIAAVVRTRGSAPLRCYARSVQWGVPRTRVPAGALHMRSLSTGVPWRGGPFAYSVPTSFLTAQGTRQHVFFDVANGRDGRDWGFVLATRPGARLVVGHRYVVPSGSSAPSLVVSGDGHGCDYDGGSFLIRRATWDRRGRIVSLAASFFFTCDRKPAVRGSFWFRREYFRSAFPGA